MYWYVSDNGKLVGNVTTLTNPPGAVNINNQTSTSSGPPCTTTTVQNCTPVSTTQCTTTTINTPVIVSQQGVEWGAEQGWDARWVLPRDIVS